MNFDHIPSPDYPDLSVVVPYFNQPEQLDNALGALGSQKEVHIEVIVVDDASDMPCDAVIGKFRQQGLNVTLIRQERRSYTLAARLRGMEVARGRWLAFVDADDELASHTAYADVIRRADAMPADILHYRVQAVDRDGFVSHWPYAAPFYSGRLEGRDIFAVWLQNQCPAHSVWNKLYCRELYQKVAGLDHNLLIYRIEDFYLTAHFLFFARSYVSCDEIVYKYFLPGATHLAKAAGRAFDAMRMYMNFPARFQSFGLDRELCEKLRSYIGALVTLNGGRMSRLIPEDVWKWQPFELDFSSEGMRTILQYGSRKDLFLLLALTNASNVRKLRGLNHIINGQR